MRRLINTKIFPNRIIDIYEKGVMKTCLEINRKNEKTVKFITVGKHLGANKPFVGKYFTQFTG